MKNRKIRFVVAQPLIGGMPIGLERAFDCPPLAIISAGFANDDHYIQYMNDKRSLDIPVIMMNDDYETFQTPEDEKLYNEIVKDIDVLMHVAVCAGLSQMNSSNSGSKKRGCADNDQNQNMYALTRLGMRVNAKVVTFENAPTAYTKSGAAVIDRLRGIANDFKYSTQLVKTDTLLHGIPQQRKRTFIMFYRDTNPGFFNYEKVPFKNLIEYLDEIPEDAGNQTIVDEKARDDFYYFVLNHTKSETFLEAISKLDPENKKSTWTSLQLTQKIGFDKAIVYFEENDNEKSAKLSRHCLAKVKDGKNFWDSSTFLTHQGRYMNAVVNKAANRMLQPKYERGYTIRELLWLMGHPHDFDLATEKNWGHISQNVPVKTATYIGGQIKNYLNNELELSNSSFVKQNNDKQVIDEGDNELDIKDDEW